MCAAFRARDTRKGLIKASGDTNDRQSVGVLPHFVGLRWTMTLRCVFAAHARLPFLALG